MMAAASSVRRSMTTYRSANTMLLSKTIRGGGGGACARTSLGPPAVTTRAMVGRSRIGSLWFSTQPQPQPIRILYASQTGTAQLFAHQLEDEINEELPHIPVSVLAWQDQPATELLSSSLLEQEEHEQYDNLDQSPLNIFLCSVTGVGEPPDNGREFYNYIMNTDTTTGQGGSDAIDSLEYAVFGLGNSKAHPNHYNVIAMSLDKRLEELGATRVQELGLGDDGDCIEDDFDQWMESILEIIKNRNDNNKKNKTNGSAVVATSSNTSRREEAQKKIQKKESPAKANESIADKDMPLRVTCPGATSPDGMRLISKKYPRLTLESPQTDICREDLFHLQGPGNEKSFYKENTAKLHILSNKILSPNAGEQALNEMRVSLQDFYLDDGTDDTLEYETGDHLVVYPRNAQYIVEAYLKVLDVHPHAIITNLSEEDGKNTFTASYPYPNGLTVHETLSHCVDLGALPSPALARQILGRKELDYKEEIAIPRRTVIDLMLSEPNSKQLSLEDLLYQMVPMKPRYYSIASSNIATPNEIRLTFRPVKYMTSRGVMREGVATSYLSRKGVGVATRSIPMPNDSDDEKNYGSLAAYVNSNPTFRLPQDPITPVMMIAGGCGVAPIRAFVHERIALEAPKYGPGILYLGFRNPSDAVYQSLIDSALECGALTEAQVCFDHGCSEPSQRCRRVSQLLRSDGNKVWQHLQKDGGNIYLCGGARTFGAAIERELIEIFQEHGQLTIDEASDYLRELVATGRLMEDLAD